MDFQGWALMIFTMLLGLWQVLECFCERWPKPFVTAYGRYSLLGRRMKESELRGVVGLVGTIMAAGSIVMMVFVFKAKGLEQGYEHYRTGGAANLPAVAWVAPLVTAAWWLVEAAIGKGIIVRTLNLFFAKNGEGSRMRARVLLAVMALVELCIGAYLLGRRAGL